MPNDDQTQQQNQSTPPTSTSEAQTSGENTASGDPPRNADGTFAPKADWQQGRSAEEIAVIADQLYQSMVQGTPPPANVPQPQPAPQPAQPAYPGYPQPQPAQPQYAQPQTMPAGAPQPVVPSDDQWLQAPGQAAQQLATTVVDQVTQAQQPQFQQFYANQAQTNLALARTQFADDFKRYGPEIELKLRQLAPDPQLHTPENISHVINLVRGAHAHEIQQEAIDAELQRRMEAGTIRPSGDVAGTSIAATDTIDLNSDELPVAYRQQLQRVGIHSLSQLDEFLRVVDGQDCNIEESRKKWFDQAKAGHVIFEGATGWRRELPMEQKKDD